MKYSDTDLVNFETPILFLNYNRPEMTQNVLDILRSFRPKKIFVAADGAKRNNAKDINRCRETREVLRRGLDWECRARFMFPDENLGCRNAVSSAITWFFQEVEEGIILEDDCVPNSTFFRFCQELLSRYREDYQIMHIGGANYLKGTWGRADYYFSIYNNIWGWATWRRAWHRYDVDMVGFQDFTKNMMPPVVRSDREAAEYWMKIFRMVYEKRIDTWDYQWTYAIWKNEGLSITPKKNLVCNVGFSKDATHTREMSKLANIPVSEMRFPLRHPRRMVTTRWADGYSSRHVYGIRHSYPIGRVKGIARKVCINMLPFGIVQLLKKRFSGTKATRSLVLYEKMSRRCGLKQDVEVDLLGASILVPDFESFCKAYKAFFVKEVLKFEAESETPVIVDLGANIGVSIAYLKNRYPRAKVYAVEINAKLFGCLKANLARLGLNDVKAINESALYAEKELSTLQDGADRGRFENGTAVAGTTAVKDLGAGRLLDSFEKIDLLRMDVGGAEAKVLAVCERYLKKIDRLYIAYHSDQRKMQELDKILAILIRNDFRIHLMTEQSNSTPFIVEATTAEYDSEIYIFAYKLKKRSETLI